MAETFPENNFWTISGFWIDFWFDFWRISGHPPESAGIAEPEFQKYDKTRGKRDFPSAGIRRHPPESAGTGNCPEIVRKLSGNSGGVRKLFGNYFGISGNMFSKPVR